MKKTIIAATVLSTLLIAFTVINTASKVKAQLEAGQGLPLIQNIGLWLAGLATVGFIAAHVYTFCKAKRA